MTSKFIILGCGSSMGVPRVDGYWGECNANEKKNYRTRCSALISTKNKNILIDTSPDLRFQMLKNKIKTIDIVLYSHLHADQTHGINDLRAFYIKNKKKIPVYADKLTYTYLRNNFSYCFENERDYPAILNLMLLKKKMIVDGLLFNTITVKHGNIESQSFIINKKCAYASDVDLIYKNDLQFFFKLDYLVIDCLRFKYHSSHFNLENVLELVKEIKPKKTILTNLHSDIDYNKILKFLPKNVIPAFDGMTFKI